MHKDELQRRARASVPGLFSFAREREGPRLTAVLRVYTEGFPIPMTRSFDGVLSSAWVARGVRGLVAAAGVMATGVFAQTPAMPLPTSAHYSIVQGDKKLGEAQYSVTPVAGGYALTSGGRMSLAKFSYGFHNESTVDSSFNLVRDTLSGSVNGTKAHGSNISFSTASDATGREFQIQIAADGKQTTNTVDRHRNTVLVPDLDPAAYLLMARLALTGPQSAWVLIPKETGLLVPTAYEPQADVRGTLNGATIAVKHTTAALSDANSVTLELYYTADGQLLEADLNAQDFDVVRDGFRLLEHPAPTPPPPGQAPPQQQPGQQPQGMMAAPQAQ